MKRGCPKLPKTAHKSGLLPMRSAHLAACENVADISRECRFGHLRKYPEDKYGKPQGHFRKMSWARFRHRQRAKKKARLGNPTETGPTLCMF